jgi:Flp pilus assembly protein TadG
MWHRVWVARQQQKHRNRSLKHRRAERGQALVFIALLMTVLLGMLGLVVDSGYAYSERRQIQNAADSAALNGARDLDAQIANGNQTGADTQVLKAIQQYIVAFNLTVNTSGNAPASLQSAVYINEDGSQTFGTVGTQSSNHIPISATGVRVVVKEPWTPFLIGVLGFGAFTIAATAAAASGVIPGANVVFLDCNNEVDLTISGASQDVITGSVFVNGSAKVSGGSNMVVTGSFGVSGTIQGTVNAQGGTYQNQPPQQFPLPDVAFPVGTTGASLGSYYVPPSVYPEFDQEAYWDFYLNYNLNLLPGQGAAGGVPLNNGNYVDLYFEVTQAPDALNHVTLTDVLKQISDVTTTPNFAAYQGHYSVFFKQWLQNNAASLFASPPSWLHFVDVANWAGADPAKSPVVQTEPQTWYTLQPSVLGVGVFGFTAQPTSHPVGSFGGKCPTSQCWSSGIWWMLNWASGDAFKTPCLNSTPCIDMTNTNAAWVSPSGTFYSENIPTAGTFVGITLMTNVAFFYKSNGANQAIHGWGYTSAAAIHPAESVYYAGWGALGTLYVPRTVLYSTFMEPLPTDCSGVVLPDTIHFDGANQSVHGFVMAPYGSISFNGSGASNFNGEIFAAQLDLNGGQVHLTYDTKSAGKGDPVLIQ